MRVAILTCCLLNGVFLTTAFADAPSGYTDRVSHRELVASKRGTVIDAQTGAGIADATVIARYMVSSHAMEHDSYGCVFRSIVHTDANGQFSLPDVSQEPALNPQPPPTPKNAKEAAELAAALMIARAPDYDWQLAVFKSGYVRESDLEIIKKYPPEQFGFDWNNYTPKTFVGRGGYQLKPVKLKKPDLSVLDQIGYLSVMHSFISCQPNPPLPSSAEIEYKALIELIRGQVRITICHAPANTLISATVVRNFYGLIRVGDDYHPQNEFDQRMQLVATRGAPRFDWKNTTAGALCWALNGLESLP